MDNSYVALKDFAARNITDFSIEFVAKQEVDITQFTEFHVNKMLSYGLIALKKDKVKPNPFPEVANPLMEVEAEFKITGEKIPEEKPEKTWGKKSKNKSKEMKMQDDFEVVGNIEGTSDENAGSETE